MNSKKPYVDPDGFEKETQKHVDAFKLNLKHGFNQDEVDEIVKSGDLHDTILKAIKAFTMKGNSWTTK